MYTKFEEHRIIFIESIGEHSLRDVQKRTSRD